MPGKTHNIKVSDSKMNWLKWLAIIILILLSLRVDAVRKAVSNVTGVDETKITKFSDVALPLTVGFAFTLMALALVSVPVVAIVLAVGAVVSFALALSSYYDVFDAPSMSD